MNTFRIVCMLLSCCATGTATSQETLRRYADSLGLNIGVCMGRSFDRNIQEHNNLVRREFNMVVAENSMKASSIHPSKGQTRFSGPDNLVRFAQENNMSVRGHTLVWHSQNASWICTGDRRTSLENMKYHITTVMEHFKGKVLHWDVVNEAFDGGELRNSVWTQSIGDDFIDSAFVYAHAADPDCILFYNDYSISWINDKSNAIYNMVKRMIANDIPIHGVGFQCHRSTSDAGATFYSDVKENFKRFADLGIEIAITELDVKGSDFSAQADIYSGYLRVALEMPKIKTYMIWGVRDQDSWVSPTPLIFDNNWQPKPAYDAILELLKDPPSEDIPVWTLPGYHQAQKIPAGGGVSIHPAHSTIMNNNNRPTYLECFDLLGARTGSYLLPANRSVSLSSLTLSSGTTIIRAGNELFRVNNLQNRN